jgi:hypothetical protein
MGFKTGFVIGVGVGYVLATRLDPTTRDRIESTVVAKMNELRDDPRVRDVISTATTVAEDALDSARQPS